MTPAELSSVIVAAVRGAVGDGELAVPVPAAVPLRGAHDGDGYATPLPLRLGAAAGRSPGEVAALLAKRLAPLPGLRDVRVTGPGVLTVSPRVPGTLIPEILEAGDDYGRAPVRRPAGPLWPRYPLTFGNAGFLVRFAHVRAASTARHAADLGIAGGPLHPESLDERRERALLVLLGEFPRRAAQAAGNVRSAKAGQGGENGGDPRVLGRHLERVADVYHDVHEHCPALPRGDEQPTERHHARLWLAAAARLVLAGGLRMLGEVPPERL